MNAHTCAGTGRTEFKRKSCSDGTEEATTVMNLVGEEGVKEGTGNRDMGGGALELGGFNGHLLTMMEI